MRIQGVLRIVLVSAFVFTLERYFVLLMRVLILST